MDETLRQLGQLLLGSIPTVLFLLLLWGSYALLLHKPLSKVLEERRSRTEGALARAEADLAAVEARTAEYEQRLRETRVALFRRQEERRQQATENRAKALREARARTQAHVEQARHAIENDKVAAQEELQLESGRLASEIVRVILQPGGTSLQVGGDR
ncbi:MAG TPA: ATP synthase F0 subunit B [Terriglobales bacterium]|nr:ATP synthase F0 subunit B [Terriglobales bacterium]